MKELFTSFTPETLWTWAGQFIIIAISLKAFLEMWDWFKKRMQSEFKKESDEERQNNSLIQKIDELNQYQIKNGEEMRENFNELKEEVSRVNERVELLTNSDKESIKQFIIEKHMHFMSEGWVDSKSYEIILTKFDYYKAEGGNSYIHELIDDIKNLPKTPPRSVYEILHDSDNFNN